MSLSVNDEIAASLSAEDETPSRDGIVLDSNRSGFGEVCPETEAEEVGRSSEREVSSEREAGAQRQAHAQVTRPRSRCSRAERRAGVRSRRAAPADPASRSLKAQRHASGALFNS